MRRILIAALLSFAVAGCSSEPVAVSVDPTPSSWELQAKKDAERDQKRRDAIESKKRKAKQEIERAKTAELRRLVEVAKSDNDRAMQARIRRISEDLKTKCCTHVYQLLKFKDDADFKAIGFSGGPSSPYQQWMMSLKALHNEAKSLPVDLTQDFKIDLLLKHTPSEIEIVADAIERGDPPFMWKGILDKVKTRIGYSDYIENLKK